MCGIVGVMDYNSSAVIPQGMTIFMQMLHADAVRGMHGTGALAIDKDGTNYRIRAGGPPHELVGSADFGKFEKFIQEKYVRVVVGHNRFATRGGHTTEFAHPFRDGDITLIHNGTLEDGWKKALPDGKKYESDSAALCHGFATVGPEKAIKSIEGAWSLVWYDALTKTINFLRNKERPLWFAMGDGNDHSIYFASEAPMLEWILMRNNKTKYTLKELPVDSWYSFTLDHHKPHVKPLEGGKSKSYNDGGWSEWGKSQMREEAVGSGKVPVVESDKVLVLPPPKKSIPSLSPYSAPANSSPSGHQHQTDLTANRRSSKSDKTAGTKPFYQQAKAIHDLGLDSIVTIEPFNFKVIQDASDRKDTLYQIIGKVDDYPDIDFLCNVKGEKNLDSLVYAAFGIRCKVRTILRSMTAVAKHRHQIHLKDPEPMYTPEPDVPDTAGVTQ